eukprot:GHVT01103270.1.p1 GENE.GHVT01103270.1~~GHVT01103270.1.p1  ORF type:complete len:177 (+),score=11.73 GHVT01103270.1:33-533(+)
MRARKSQEANWSNQAATDDERGRKSQDQSGQRGSPERQQATTFSGLGPRKEARDSLHWRGRDDAASGWRRVQACGAKPATERGGRNNGSQCRRGATLEVWSRQHLGLLRCARRGILVAAVYLSPSGDRDPATFPKAAGGIDRLLKWSAAAIVAGDLMRQPGLVAGP